MVPVRALAEPSWSKGRRSLVRYNGYRAAIINGAAKPGFSSGQALAAMERISATTLPAGYGYEWTGTALQEKAASGQTADRARARLLFAYLFLVALYESWNIPISVLLSVSVAVLGAIVASRSPGAFRRLCADRPRRADRARRQERHPDRRIRDRATRAWQVDRGRRDHGARPALPPCDDDELRLHPRPGAAGDRRRARARPAGEAVGTPVFGGMLAGSLVGIFVIPMLFVVFEWMRGTGKAKGGPQESAPPT